MGQQCVQEGFDEFITAVKNTGLTENQKQQIIERPAKVFLNAVKDASSGELTIHGTSYHPGWKDEITASDIDLGNKRTMYMFKAKTRDIDSTTNGAKMYLSLPEEDATTTTGVWDDDSIGSVVTPAIGEDVSEMLARLFDATDDVDTDGEDGTDNTVVQEQLMGAVIMYWAIGDDLGIQSYDDHGFTFDATEVDAFQKYWSDKTLPKFDPADYAGVNLLTCSPEVFNTTLGTQISEESGRENIYLHIIVPALVDKALTDTGHGYSLSIDEIGAFVENENTHPDADAFKEQYNAIRYMVNPAFYDSTNRFLGTYACDGSSSCVFYKYGSGTMTPVDSGSEPDNFSTLNAMDLSDIDAYIPADVVSAVITIE